MKLLIIGLLFVIFSIYYRKGYNAYWGMLVVFFIMALQDNVTGDYDRYQSSFEWLQLGYEDGLFRNFESGWKLLNNLFKYFPFEVMIGFIAFIEYLILSKFIEKYTKQEFKFAAALIFFFHYEFMLFQMKGLRQAFAVDLLVLAFMLLDARKTLAAAAVAAIASTMHNSAFIGIPFLILLYFVKDKEVLYKPFKYKDFTLPIVLTSVFMAIYILKTLLINWLINYMFIFSFAGHKSNYLYKLVNGVNYSIVITLCGAISLFATTYYLKFTKGIERFFTLIAILSLFLEMFFFAHGELFRFNLSFSIFRIIIIPNTAKFLKDKGYELLAWTYIFMTIGYAGKTFMYRTLNGMVDGFDNYKFLLEF